MNNIAITIPSSSNNKSNLEKLYEMDRWDVKELGIEPDAAHGSYYLDFSKIHPDWLKNTAKRFVKVQSTMKSYSSCKSYINAIVRLSDYLSTKDSKILPKDITRALMLDFFSYLLDQKFGVVTRRTTLVHIRTFHKMILQENWLPWPEKPLIYSSDIPKEIISYPRYIPDSVLYQLKQSLHNLPAYLINFVHIMIETGRRISELCTLPFNCLEQDNQGDWFLRVFEKKLKKERLIPISRECYDVICKQQKQVEKDCGSTTHYLFPSLRNLKTQHVSARNINLVLNKLAQDTNINDSSGKVWRFSSHQFRHTVGTNMINNGVPQVIVQNYLGHESPEMTSRYAHVHNNTLKKAFMQYQDRIINIHGQKQAVKDISDAQWLRENIMSQALPNGLCTLPLSQQGCPHANACLTCTHFCTSKEYLPQHRDQLQKTNEIICDATNNGWARIVEVNTTVANNLKTIISTLEDRSDDQA